MWYLICQIGNIVAILQYYSIADNVNQFTNEWPKTNKRQFIVLTCIPTYQFTCVKKQNLNTWHIHSFCKWKTPEHIYFLWKLTLHYVYAPFPHIVRKLQNNWKSRWKLWTRPGCSPSIRPLSGHPSIRPWRIMLA